MQEQKYATKNKYWISHEGVEFRAINDKIVDFAVSYTIFLWSQSSNFIRLVCSNFEFIKKKLGKKTF